MSDDNTATTENANLTSRLANDPRLEPLLKLDSAWLDKALTIGVFLLALVLLFETRRYDWAAQRVPVFVFGVVLILSFVEILKEFDVISWWGVEGDDDDIQTDIEERTETDDIPLAHRRVEMLRMVVWIISLLVVVNIVGLLPGSLLFLVAFYYLDAAVGFVRTIVYSGVIFLFVWVVFEVLLKARLYPGIFELGEAFYVSGSLF